MSTDTVHLAKLIILESFGPIVENVASVLIKRGRSTLRQIVQETNLKPKLVKDSLFVLLQHNLILYRTVPKLDKEETFYEIHLKNILNRIHLTHGLKLVQQHYGEMGLYVMDVILLYGKCKWSGIQDYFESDSDHKNSDLSIEIKKLKNAFCQMVETRLLKAVQPQDMLSSTEKLIVAEEDQIEKSKVPLMSTDIKKMRQEIQNRQAFENASETIIGIKRGRPQDDPLIDDDIFFNLNYTQLFVLIRQEVITDLATELTNPQGASVVREIIEKTSSSIVSCSTPQSSSVAIYNISTRFTSDPEFERSISYGPQAKDKPKAANNIGIYVDILQNPQFNILSKNDMGQVFMNYSKLNRHLKVKLIEKFVKNRFGTNTLRVFRCLSNSLKMDEKQIIKDCLMMGKDCRQHLETLSVHGLIQLQEVPRTADRSAVRCLYLWGFDLDYACRCLTQMAYKSLANLQKVRQVEKQKRQLLLNKLERKDVQSNDDLLTDYDKKQRALWIKIQDRLDWAQLKLSCLLAALENFN